MNIGQAAQASGVTAKMIRYYESIGLMPPSPRSEAGYRRYGEQDLHLLRFIRQSRRLGFGIDQIRQLLALWQDRGRSSAQVKALAQSHVDELNQRIGELVAMRDTLSHLAMHCHGDDRPDCPILEGIAAAALPDNVATKAECSSNAMTSCSPAQQAAATAAAATEAPAPAGNALGEGEGQPRHIPQG
ncbi:Cu(I)-responsive transcriptional regulator [Pandoraea fibrosis]|uniref:Cu(I)-responsive transcriptional regulator n=1 Tax=Pandoraea fibrosis TaxID=1891094 RepID=A0A5E4YI05_9BURK|nr:Cu(I)-responsive transcriptional regulator [Pandoraea fibrosis]QHF13135.1 Cu(I)-responsive transcriptional regulator [Pandoraea fibrosis]VVE48137.1 MerR family transcriptional regulator [Pandoraea fibrosis]